MQEQKISEDMQSLAFESFFLALDNDNQAGQDQEFVIARSNDGPMLSSSVAQEDDSFDASVCLYFCYLSK